MRDLRMPPAGQPADPSATTASAPAASLPIGRWEVSRETVFARILFRLFREALGNS
jgi:hypothetical protein